MTTSAVRAYYSEDGNYLDILFDGVIDISASSPSSAIGIHNGSIAVQVYAGATFKTVADSKYIRIEVTSAYAAVIEAWSDAQKQAATLTLSAGALTDIDGNGTAALSFGSIRCHFTKESSLNTTFGNYHAAGETVYLPRNVNITQDITALDQPLSTGIVKFEGYDASTVVSGTFGIGPATLSTTADPTILQLERMTYNGNINFSTSTSADWIDGSANTGTDYDFDDAKYAAFSFTAPASKSFADIVLNMRKKTISDVLIDNTSYTGSDIGASAYWTATSFTTPAYYSYADSITMRLKTTNGSFTTATVYIMSDDGGSPSEPNSVLASCTISGLNTITYTEATGTFSTKLELSPSTKYWIVVGNVAGTYIIAEGDGTGTNTLATSNDLSTWSVTTGHIYFSLTDYAATYPGTIYATIYSDNGGSPGEPLSTLTTGGKSASSLSLAYSEQTFSKIAAALTASATYWLVVNYAYLDVIEIDSGTAAGTLKTSSDGSSWTGSATQSFYHKIDQSVSASQHLGGGMKNVIWNGTFISGTSYYFAGLSIFDARYRWTLDRCTWRPNIAYATGGEAAWNCINSKIANDSDSTTLFDTDYMSMVMAYCEVTGGTATFSSGSNLTIYNCKDNNTTPSNVTNDTTNATGLTGLSLADSQGYGYISGGSLNAGRAFTQLDGGDSPGERAVGVPRGSMVGVGAFAAIPAKVITPVSASVSGTVVTYTLPSGSFDVGDNVRGNFSNVEDTANNVIAQDTILSTTAS